MPKSKLSDDQSDPAIEAGDRELLVAPEALSQVCDLLNVATERREEVCARLQGIAEEFEATDLFEAIMGLPKAQKRAISQLAGSLRRTLDKLAGISAVYSVALQTLTGDGTTAGSEIDLIALNENLSRLANAAEAFLERYKPRQGRFADLPLERSVRSLLELIETGLGQEVAISWNKNKKANPAPRSNGAKAIVLFMEAVGPGLTTTAILDMIQKVRTQPEETESQVMAIFEAQDAWALAVPSGYPKKEV